ncbi:MULTISPECIES: zinc-ribbon domain-containing protein [Microbacterium]|uniref:zinc-ribbon domain-containing protein n=1 Tax=Microbacterium TaxID=33882 RepID=UPI000D6490CB|nr:MULTISPECIES: zinc-ribbon domain-containing protein [Microbacterium]
MAERVELWWARRQFSKGAEVPYQIGAYRSAWASYPALVRQYHPELNAGITLTQIPPAADVLLLWECEAGHRFAATPSEQRARPGRERRRSAWCPECSTLARPPRVSAGAPAAEAPRRGKPSRRLCSKTPDLPVGEAFSSVCAPKPASAAEARLRSDIFESLAVTTGCNAIRTARPFFDHLEVWPDILLPELRIAVEYDTVGKHGLEHVGRREDVDRRKDRAVRASGWEVVRLRTGKLEPLGPYDLQLASWTKRGRERLLDAFREIRGPLLVDAYLR